MAISLYVGPVSIDVDDPGYGYLRIFRAGGRDDDDLELVLRGRYMWRALENLTELVCNEAGESRGDVDGLWPMSVLEASRLLPAFQQAVLYAAAGGDRAERLAEDEDGTEDVLCARCNLGSPYAGHVTESAHCERYGHQPFGYAVNWQQAQEAVARERQWAESRRRMAEPVTVPTDTAGRPE
ncbi:MAG TPA: hypothetical protein VIQ30_12720 [Pseudonocardia sp.]